MRDANGDVIAVLGVSVEVTALRREQARNTMLVRELAHRSKNLLDGRPGDRRRDAAVGRGAGDFLERFGARLQSLARLQDLVVSGTRGGVELGELVRIGSSRPSPSRASGSRSPAPRCGCRPEAANMLGMALHELATNATKYGCLSVPEGAVLVAWRLEPDTDGAQRFRLTWRESGGPPVVEAGAAAASAAGS